MYCLQRRALSEALAFGVSLYHQELIMFATELFLALSITSFLGLSAAPGIASDPALVTKLEQARPVMRGKRLSGAV